jgi:hypothetical protein
MRRKMVGRPNRMESMAKIYLDGLVWKGKIEGN